MRYILEKKSLPGAAKWVEYSHDSGSSDFYQTSIAISPGNVVNELFFAPYDMVLQEVNAYCHSGATSVEGTYFLFVSDETTSNNLLLDINGFDLEVPNLPAATLKPVGLTGETANLSMPKGSVIRMRVVSNNPDLTAEGLYVQLIFNAQ